jgi:outer membrane protein assembly factor BamB
MRSSEHIRRTFLLAALALSLSACGGSDDGAQCNLSGGTELAPTPTSNEAPGSDWPRFHRDRGNTGRTEVALPATAGNPRPIFPPVGTRIGAVSTTPILGPDGRIFFGSQDGTVYAIDRDGEPLFFDDEGQPEHLVRAAPVSATPLLGKDGTLFVAGGDGSLLQYDIDGILRESTLVGGFISTGPNIGNDGTVYVGSLGGAFGGVCPNGVPRFLLLFSPVQAAPAVTNDPEDTEDLIIINAEESGQVRGFDIRGRQRWSFFASAGVRGAVVIDEESGRFFVADASGRVFSASVLDGKRRGVCSEDPALECATDADCAGACVLFAFRAARCAGDLGRVCATNQDCVAPASCVGETVSAAPALGLETLYVVSETGTLYALDSRSGDLRWLRAVDARVLSAPAVAVDATGETVVFGADDGFLYALRDGEVLWSVSLGAAVGTSSPSIASDGTIYIGTSAGVLYAIP